MTKQFIFKIIRNGFILAGLYFFSIYSATDIMQYKDFKPVIIFLGTYIFAEMANHFRINALPPKQRRIEQAKNITLFL